MSGLLRLAVLEIVARPAPESSIVASAFGTRVQWFRNVHANPQVGLPRAWHMLRPAVETTLLAHIVDQTTPLPLIALDPAPQVHRHTSGTESGTVYGNAGITSRITESW